MAEFSIEKIKDILKSKGYNYERLSKETGISISSISKILGGFNKNPTLKYLQAIAKALDCSMDDFFDWQGQEPTSPYYLDRKTGEIAQEMFENPELKALFDSARDLSSEELETIKTMINTLKGKRN